MTPAIPASVQSFVTARIAEIDAQVAPMMKERAELIAYLDGTTAPQTRAVAAPAVREKRKQRQRLVPARCRGGAERPHRIRDDGQIERLFKSGSYAATADKIGVGVASGAKAVWLTDTEWRRVMETPR